MPGVKKSKNHHWWPVALQTSWANSEGDVCWIDPSGTIFRKRAENRKIGFMRYGHTIFRGRGVLESNFESEFDIDNQVHLIIAALHKLKPFGRTPSVWANAEQLPRAKISSRRRLAKDPQMWAFRDLLGAATAPLPSRLGGLLRLRQ